MLDIQRLRAAYEKVRDELLAERTEGGYWVGELSSSALATATAVSALAIVRQQVQSPKSKVQSQRHNESTLDLGPWTTDSLNHHVAAGVAWLTRQQNSDGGFGDTDLSHSNIATTYLVVAALHLAKSAVGNALRGVPEISDDALNAVVERANAYIDSKGCLRGLRERYGMDKTFVVPIMANLALAGLVDWREVDPLPFELACVPQSWYRFVGMPVVSYAIPALVAIGQARYFHALPRNPFTRLIRHLSIHRSLKVLRRMQPDSGGYLEATPLTSFVVMSLAETLAQSASEGSAREIASEIIRGGVEFLINSARPDGSWPIDTNLATWNTTLAINALAGAGEDVAELLGCSVGNALRGVRSTAVDADSVDHGTPQRACPTENVLDWLLSCQHTQRHPFTGANPGGFGWSDLSGAVPDADDTPGAMLALTSLRPPEYTDASGPRNSNYIYANLAMIDAVSWLMKLQNRDGGWPTFCQGWGKLPFDRSGVDLTAHALRAIALWFGRESESAKDFSIRNHSFKRGLNFIERNQRSNGSWSPLWFGNQNHPNEDNPVYGTAKVLMAYRELGLMDSPEAQRGVAWLLDNQNPDGGWGSGVWRMRNDECRMMNDADHGASNPKSKIQNLKSSVEETALAVEALLAACPTSPQPPAPGPALAAVARGLFWLLDRAENNQHRQPAPIGFYFAKLWYYERLYPLIFTVAALGRACQQFAPPAQSAATPEPSESRAR